MGWQGSSRQLLPGGPMCMLSIPVPPNLKVLLNFRQNVTRDMTSTGSSVPECFKSCCPGKLSYGALPSMCTELLYRAPLQPGSPLAETLPPPASHLEPGGLQGPWVTVCPLTGLHTWNEPCDSPIYGLSHTCQLLKCWELLYTSMQLQPCTELG